MPGKVELNHEGREYLHFPVTGLPSIFVEGMEAKFPPATEWVPMEWVVSVAGIWEVWDGVTGTPTHARILIAGPNAEGTGGVALAAASSTTPRFRMINNPEVIIRTSPTAIVITS